MTQYKLFKYVAADKKKFIGWFGNDSTLINFFNNPRELRHYTNLRDINNFKTIIEVKVYVALNGCVLHLGELEK
jgi:hypothetical protein